MTLNVYIIKKLGTFLNETLAYIGIVIQNNKNIHVKSSSNLTLPYIVFTEGFISEPSIFNKVREFPNINVIYDNVIVIEKRTNLTDEVVLLNGLTLDLYDNRDNKQFQTVIEIYENNRKFYCKNTEIMHPINESNSVVGLSSGYYLAELAFRAKSKHVIFFDYSKISLNLQKQLIEVSDRKQLLINNLHQLTVGDRDALTVDLTELDFNQIDIYYNYLRSVNVEFHQLDIRTELNKLCEIVPEHSTLWISNTLHYVTTIPYYDIENYKLLDNLVENKNVTLLPHTRVYYES